MHQFQAMDIIAGRMCPELGGREEFLDILGFNYYWSSQWEHAVGTLPWPEYLPMRSTVASLLEMAYQRYQKPLFLSETGHFGCGRAEWIEEITQECVTAINNGVELLGACIYPVTDRPDWDNLTSYSDCGIYDLDQDKNRIPHLPSINAIFESTQVINLCLKNASQKQATEEIMEAAAIAFEMSNMINYETL